MTDQAITHGVHHVGLTVPDVEVTAAFFISTLGFKRVGGRPDYPAIFISDGQVMLTIWGVQDTDRQREFDRKNTVGLHHLALKMRDLDTLYDTHTQLSQASDVTIEFAPSPMGDTQTIHFICAIPGGIRLELVATGSMIREAN